jgi:hypothetical protein
MSNLATFPDGFGLQTAVVVIGHYCALESHMEAGDRVSTEAGETGTIDFVGLFGDAYVLMNEVKPSNVLLRVPINSLTMLEERTPTQTRPTLRARSKQASWDAPRN